MRFSFATTPLIWKAIKPKKLHSKSQHKNSTHWNRTAASDAANYLPFGIFLKKYMQIANTWKVPNCPKSLAVASTPLGLPPNNGTSPATTYKPSDETPRLIWVEIENKRMESEAALNEKPAKHQ